LALGYVICESVNTVPKPLFNLGELLK
jgi:hypothetical protein